MKEIIVKSDINHLYDVLSEITGAIEHYILPKKFYLQLELAIEELFVNICNYAYENDGDILIQYSVEENPLRIIINFIDNGVMFNPLEKEPPDLTAGIEERKIGGLGLTLVRNHVDDIRYKYENNQNILTIEKIF